MINSKHFQTENSKPLNLYLKIAVIKGNCVPMICVLWILNLRKQIILKYFVASAVFILGWMSYISIHKIKLPFPFPRTPNLHHNTALPFEKEKQISSKNPYLQRIDWTLGFHIHKACTSSGDALM